MQNFYLPKKSFWISGGRHERETEAIAGALLELTREYGTRFTEIAFQNTVLYISLSISRMKKGFFIGASMPPIPDKRVRRETELAVKLYERLDVEAVHNIHMGSVK